MAAAGAGARPSIAFKGSHLGFRVGGSLGFRAWELELIGFGVN